MGQPVGREGRKHKLFLIKPHKLHTNQKGKKGKEFQICKINKIKLKGATVSPLLE